MTDDECNVFLNAVFALGTSFGQESNSGSDPGDQRSTIINAITSSSYLPSVCPGNAPGQTATTCTFDATDVFAQTFTPTN